MMLLLVSWTPEGTPVRKKMKFSTFKASTVVILRELASEKVPVLQVKVFDEDDLEGDLIGKASEKRSGDCITRPCHFWS